MPRDRLCRGRRGGASFGASLDGRSDMIRASDSEQKALTLEGRRPMGDGNQGNREKDVLGPPAPRIFSPRTSRIIRLPEFILGLLTRVRITPNQRFALTPDSAKHHYHAVILRHEPPKTTNRRPGLTSTLRRDQRFSRATSRVP